MPSGNDNKSNANDDFDDVHEARTAYVSAVDTYIVPHLFVAVLLLIQNNLKLK